jgi:hypothetical protein
MNINSPWQNAALRPPHTFRAKEGLCCTNGLTVKIPLSAGRLIPRFQSRVWRAQGNLNPRPDPFYLLQGSEAGRLHLIN